VVFTPAEVRAVLAHHKGDYRLMTELLYGAGLLQSVCHDTLPWLISVSLDLAVQMPSAVAKVLNRAATLVVEYQYERERTKFPESRVGAIRVHGPEPFVSDIKEALAQLQRCYPYGYSLVQRYVRGIIDTDVRRRNGETIQVLFVRATPEGRLQFPPDRFAANLVRHAVV
jgi:hypothetical protein